MQRERDEQQERETATRTPSPPVVAPAPAPSGLGSAQAVLAMQRTAGNAATAAALRGGTPGPVVARNPFKWLKNKLKGKPKVKPMPKEAEAKVAQTKQAVIQAQQTIDGPQVGGGLLSMANALIGQISGHTEALKGATEKIVSEPEKPEKGEGGGETPGKTPEAETKAEGPEESPESGVGSMFDIMEALYEAELERQRKEDEELYDRIIGIASLLDPKTSSGGLGATIGYRVMESSIAAWLASPRRLAGLPEDKARKQELEALLEAKKWVIDKQQASAAALSPNPALKAKDDKGLLVATGVTIKEIKADGTLDAPNLSFNKDQYYETLVETTIDGKPGYTIPAGGKQYFVEKDKVVEKRGTFDKVTGPLFPPDPEPAHVKQTTLGDCYLQAAVAALANKNPALVKAMFQDNDDDSVTVRLYRPDESDQQKHTFSAEYIRVEKSVPKNFKGQEIYNAGALWVRLIEKAYAAGGFTGDGDAAPPVRSYEGIAGGKSGYAMQVLTGKQPEIRGLQGGGPDLMNDGSYKTVGMADKTKGGHVETRWTSGAKVPWDPAEVTAHADAKTNDNYDGLLSFKILGDKASTDAWIDFVKTDAIKTMFTKRKEDRGKGYAGDLTLADFEAAMQPLGESARNAILKWIEDNQLYPGKLGSAKYSKLQLEVFAKIKNTLESGGMVTASTFKYPKGEVTAGTGASGGEAKHGGMVGGHVYSVLKARSYSTTDPDDVKAGDFFFIRVRNPWASYGRAYDFTGAEAKGDKQDSPEFWLELSELTKYFKDINFGA